MRRKKPEHKYTQTERKKIYRLKNIKNESMEVIPSNPIGRKKLIKETYKQYPRIVYCPALNCNVAINKTVSSNKTSKEASGSKKSTSLALMLPKLIERAELVYDNRSKDNVGQSSFDRVFVLIAAVKGIGYAKITIGRYEQSVTGTMAPYCQYCVSHLSLHTLKNK